MQPGDKKATCAICGREFDKKVANQILCGDPECKRKNRALWKKKRTPKIVATGVCPICGETFEKQIHNQIICGRRECELERRARYRARYREEGREQDALDEYGPPPPEPTRRCRKCGELTWNWRLCDTCKREAYYTSDGAPRFTDFTGETLNLHSIGV